MNIRINQTSEKHWQFLEEIVSLLLTVRQNIYKRTEFVFYEGKENYENDKL